MNLITELCTLIENKKLWDKTIQLKRNEYLKVGGTIDTNLYYVKSGSLKIFIVNQYEEHIIRFGYRGNLITALDSFISDQASDFYIQALKKTELKVLYKANFIRFMEQSVEVQLIWYQLMEQFVLQQIEREKDILITSPKERFQRVFKRSPQLFQEIPSRYIASYLRMTPETLSRLKKS
jgi:CRP-like cAMP-binding protein